MGWYLKQGDVRCTSEDNHHKVSTRQPGMAANGIDVGLPLPPTKPRTMPSDELAMDSQLCVPLLVRSAKANRVKVGAEVGEEVGVKVGLTVGAVVGAEVGIIVGEDVGLRVGVAVGAEVGAAVHSASIRYVLAPWVKMTSGLNEQTQLPPTTAK